MSDLMRIVDGNGIYKTIPYIRGADGQEAYALAVSEGFTGTEAKFNENLAGMDNPYYPVGAVYYSVVSTSPASIFGFGSWTQLEDVFILSMGSTYTTLSATGGAATHTLTVNQLPEHRHYETRGRYNEVSNCMYTPVMAEDGTITTTATGDGGAHNNMPPYQVVYAWKRVS